MQDVLVVRSKHFGNSKLEWPNPVKGCLGLTVDQQSMIGEVRKKERKEESPKFEMS